MNKPSDFTAVERARKKLLHDRLRAAANLLDENAELAMQMTNNNATVAAHMAEVTRIIIGGAETTKH